MLVSIHRNQRSGSNVLLVCQSNINEAKCQSVVSFANHAYKLFSIQEACPQGFENVVTTDNLRVVVVGTLPKCEDFSSTFFHH